MAGIITGGVNCVIKSIIGQTGIVGVIGSWLGA